MTDSVPLEPGAARTLAVPLRRTSSDTLDGKLFGLRGYPVTLGGDHTVDPSNITQLLLFVNKPSAPHEFEVGDMAKLNEAWGAHHKSWKMLLASRKAPDLDRARVDLEEFYARAADRYFATVGRVIREVAPHQLYLGCRFAWVNDLVAVAAGEYCDVVSCNRYERGSTEFASANHRHERAALRSFAQCRSNLP